MKKLIYNINLLKLRFDNNDNRIKKYNDKKINLCFDIIYIIFQYLDKKTSQYFIMLDNKYYSFFKDGKLKNKITIDRNEISFFFNYISSCNPFPFDKLIKRFNNNSETFLIKDLTDGHKNPTNILYILSNDRGKKYLSL